MLDELKEGVGNVLYHVFGSQSDRILRALKPKVAQVNSLEGTISKYSNEQMRAKTEQYRSAIAAIRETDPQADENGAVDRYLDEILPEAYALVREAARRTTGKRPFDVQLLGGMALHKGTVAEMATGEGKTLVAALPAYLNALPKRKGENGYVHVVTVNDYLASRDCELNKPIFNLLGLTAGTIQSKTDSQARKFIYRSDVVYGTNSEFGFDYLRDNIAHSADDQVQKKRHFAIVDEADSILIDEARTPLILSGESAEVNKRKYEIAALVAHKLVPTSQEEKQRIEDLRLEGIYEEPRKGHYIVDEKDHSVTLTEAGMNECHKILNIDTMYDGDNIIWPHLIDNALKAKELYKNNTHYVLAQGKKGLDVIIVDEFTGRKMEGRRWSDGLHQAVEAKERIILGNPVNIEGESETLGTITYQNLFKMYKKLAGMTGTAQTESKEFAQVYKMDTLVVPTNKPMVRDDRTDVIYGTEREKWDAICDDIEAHYRAGSPVLVGTTSVEKSERLAQILSQRGYAGKFKVLNAKVDQIAKEAGIIQDAGSLGAITIATNMAGRGTDIQLGSYTTAQLLDHWKKAKYNGQQLCPDDVDAKTPGLEDRLYVHWASIYLPDQSFSSGKQAAAALERYWKSNDVPSLRLAQNVEQLGGLHVIGSERHEARRIDNQLRGRAGRQGDRGSSRFFLSLEDDLMRKFMPQAIRSYLQNNGVSGGVPLESRLVSNQVKNAQLRVEEHHFAIRKNLLSYDDVMTEQRKTVYGLRQNVLEGMDTRELLQTWIQEMVERAVQREEPERLIHWAKNVFGIQLPVIKDNTRPAELQTMLTQKLQEAYTAREQVWGEQEVPTEIPIEYSPEELQLPYEAMTDMACKKIGDIIGLPADQPQLRAYVQESMQLNKCLPASVAVPRRKNMMREIERVSLMNIVDDAWKTHIADMEYQRQGIHLKSYGGKDPKIEYKRVGFELFEEMLESVQERVIGLVLRMRKPEEMTLADVPAAAQ